MTPETEIASKDTSLPPEMTPEHVDAVHLAIPCVGDHQELLDDVRDLVRSLGSGEVATYDPRREVRVPRDQLQLTHDFCRELSPLASPAIRDSLRSMQKHFTRWLGAKP